MWISSSAHMCAYDQALFVPPFPLPLTHIKQYIEHYLHIIYVFVYVLFGVFLSLLN